MSIQSEINRIKKDKENLITTLEEKGIEIADGATLGDISLDIENSEVGVGTDTSALDAFIEGATEITSNATIVAPTTFHSNRTLQKINLPVATEIAQDAFNYCRALTEVYAPEVLKVGNYGFYADEVIQKAEIPKNTRLGNGAFMNCPNLSFLPCDNVTYIGASALNNTGLTEVYAPKLLTLADNSIKNNPSLQYVELGSIAGYIYRQTFLNCPSLTALVIRATKLITLENVNAFEGTPIASGTGYIYIPSALIPNFQTATNWSTFANQFRALEDYTVDGTVTGEFDRTKI